MRIVKYKSSTPIFVLWTWNSVLSSEVMQWTTQLLKMSTNFWPVCLSRLNRHFIYLDKQAAVYAPKQETHDFFQPYVHKLDCIFFFIRTLEAYSWRLKMFKTPSRVPLDTISTPINAMWFVSINGAIALVRNPSVCARAQGRRCVSLH